MKRSKFDAESVKGFRVKLYPTKDQAEELNSLLNGSRAIYNYGLGIAKKYHDETNIWYRYFEMQKQIFNLSNTEGFGWISNIPKSIIKGSLQNLDTAIAKYLDKNLHNKMPRFKSRRRKKQSFRTRSERCHIYGDHIFISGVSSRILAKDHKIPSNTRLYNTIVSFDGYNYWFSCNIESEKIDMSDIPKSDPIGIDVGIVNTITTSDGEFFHLPDTSKYKKRIKQMEKRLQKDYSYYRSIAKSTKTKYFDIPKSKNHIKRQFKQFKDYQKIKNKNHSEINLFTKRLVDKNPSAIVIEGGLSAQEQLGKFYFSGEQKSQILYYEIHRQIKYKAHNRGIPVIEAPKDFPSSKKCSRCGNIGYFYYREFRCSHCGYRLDRDLNAAYNLRDLAYQNF